MKKTSNFLVSANSLYNILLCTSMMESRFVHTPRLGYRIHFRITTRSSPSSRHEHDSRIPVVLVHGLVVASTYMERLALALEPWFRVLIPDLPGFGLSTTSLPTSQALTVPELTEALVDWLDALGIGRAAFVGNSMGCQVIVELAARYPKYAERCVLQGPTMDATRRSIPMQIARLMLNGLREPPSMSKIMLVDYWRAGLIRSLRTIPLALRDRLDLKLPHITAPTLVVFSENDTVAPVQWCSFVARELQHGSLVCLEGAAHTANYSATSLLAQAIRDFLQRPQTMQLPSSVMTVYPKSYYRALPAADFDSATGMLRATAAALRGEGLAQLGVEKSQLLTAVVKTLNRLPESVRTQLYTWTGALEAMNDEAFGRLTTDEIYAPLLESYTSSDSQYPAIAIGSSNGALVHLYAALGIPWLPQTVLVPVKRAKHVAKQKDGETPDMVAEMLWGAAVAQPLLARNRDLQVHHMTDPIQDALMIRYMAYFRLKMIRLIASYKRFIVRHLAKGGTLIVVNCTQSWPVVRVADRHFFQPGAVGGLQPEEYLESNNAKVRASIRSNGNSSTKATDWHPPRPTEEAPEAEWGFAHELLQDITAFAIEQGYHVRVLNFEDPESMSPLVCDLYKQWYRDERRIIPQGAIIDSFILMDPWWTLRCGLIPYWSVFSVESSLRRLERHLRTAAERNERYPRILHTLFNHGVRSPGFATAAQWDGVLRNHLVHARHKNPEAIGFSAELFPLDFASVTNFHTDLVRLAEKMEQFALPEPLQLKRFYEFMQQHGASYGVVLDGDHVKKA